MGDGKIGRGGWSGRTFPGTAPVPDMEKGKIGQSQE